MMMSNKAVSKGRRKIEIKFITNYRSREITFTKRKAGLFKSASELCILCGVEIGIVIFSNKGNPFSFGNPDVNTIIDRYFNETPQRNDAIGAIEESLQRARVLDLREELNKTLKELETEKKHGEALEKCIGDAPIEELGLGDLQQLSLSLENLKKNMHARVIELCNEASCSSSLSLPPTDATRSVGFFVTDTTKISDMERQAQWQNEEFYTSLDFLPPFDSFDYLPDELVTYTTETSTSVTPLDIDFSYRVWNF
ncbi:agamous-like MADS-box protein AGL61 [Fagus crenata]